jgi:nitrate/TMAO reductase-like tetraheme cytochrome c subunit
MFYHRAMRPSEFRAFRRRFWGLLVAIGFCSQLRAEEAVDVYDKHARLFKENKFPSAAECRTCHPGHYREWSASPHAYAQLSPVFNAMQAAIDKKTSGTNGDFCIRCHTQVGMNMNEPVFMSNLDRHPTAREGITCIVCHREPYAYGKNSGRFALNEGELTEPIEGPTGNAELKRVLSHPEEYPVTSDRNRPGRKIHGDVKQFFALRTPGFCGSCHDVTLGNGFRLEELFTSFKNSPAARSGTTCQDCHMGLVPGRKSGYAEAPAAVINGVPTRPRRRTNHMFVGPDHPIIHAGLFPHNPKAADLATLRDWLAFDDAAGWGTDAFEKKPVGGYEFPPRWSDEQDRREARAVLDEQYALLKEMYAQRLALLREGYRLGKLVVKQADERKGLRFSVQVSNGVDGHAVPTGFDAERLVFLRVTVADASGKIVFRSGDLDPDGDLRDLHSAYVQSGRLPLDKYLFNLQATTVLRLPRGGERDEILATNQNIDPLPYIRPEPFSSVLTGRPAGSRTQRRGIPPLASRWPQYRVGRSELKGAGPYTVNVKLIAGMVPSNLIRSIQFVGFDYGLSPRKVADAVREGHLVLYDKTVAVTLGGGEAAFDLGALPETARAD